MKLLYLLGAGRSGTTALSLLLGSSNCMRAVGELHHISQYAIPGARCSCGQLISECAHWRNVTSADWWEKFSHRKYKIESASLELHRSIWRYFGYHNWRTDYKYYYNLNTRLFCVFKDFDFVIDSAKYICRALALKNVENLSVYYIHMVRDPRGVVHSFSKDVQSPRSFLSACFYYVLINATAILVKTTLLRGRVLTIRYEDLFLEPNLTLERIGIFLKKDLEEIKPIILGQVPIKNSHTISGNRLVKSKNIFLEYDSEWKDRFSRTSQIIIWILTFPICLICRYKP